MHGIKTLFVDFSATGRRTGLDELAYQSMDREHPRMGYFICAWKVEKIDCASDRMMSKLCKGNLWILIFSRRSLKCQPGKAMSQQQGIRDFAHLWSSNARHQANANQNRMVSVRILAWTGGTVLGTIYWQSCCDGVAYFIAKTTTQSSGTLHAWGRIKHAYRKWKMIENDWLNTRV